MLKLHIWYSESLLYVLLEPWGMSGLLMQNKKDNQGVEGSFKCQESKKWLQIGLLTLAMIKSCEYMVAG